MKALTTAFLLLFLGACATTGENFYAEDRVGNSVIIKKGGQRQGAFSWTSFTLYSVNGKLVRYGFVSAPSQTKVAPGKSKLVVLAYSEQAWKHGLLTNQPKKNLVLPLLPQQQG